MSLSGTRQKGYARITGPERGFLQVRWERKAGEISEKAVRTYLDRVRTAASRSKLPYRERLTPKKGRIAYSYNTDVSAKGVLFPLPGLTGIAFIEAVDAPASCLAKAERSFSVQQPPLERWTLHGLDVLLPYGLHLESHELKAGKTSLHLTGSKLKLIAERWGFADMLLQNRSLSEWLANLSGSKGSQVEELPCKVSLYRKRGVFPDTWIKAVVQDELNQITLVRVDSREAEHQPQWNWFKP